MRNKLTSNFKKSFSLPFITVKWNANSISWWLFWREFNQEKKRKKYNYIHFMLWRCKCIEINISYAKKKKKSIRTSVQFLCFANRGMAMTSTLNSYRLFGECIIFYGILFTQFERLCVRRKRQHNHTPANRKSSPSLNIQLVAVNAINELFLAAYCRFFFSFRVVRIAICAHSSFECVIFFFSLLLLLYMILVCDNATI